MIPGSFVYPMPDGSEPVFVRAGTFRTRDTRNRSAPSQPPRHMISALRSPIRSLPYERKFAWMSDYCASVNAIRATGVPCAEAIRQHHEVLRRQGIPHPDSDGSYAQFVERIRGAGEDGLSLGYEPSRPPPAVRERERPTSGFKGWYAYEVQRLLDEHPERSEIEAAATVTGYVYRTCGVAVGSANSFRNWRKAFDVRPRPADRPLTATQGVEKLRNAVGLALRRARGSDAGTVNAAVDLLADCSNVDEVVEVLEAIAA